jgi:hypothetical protein
VGARVQFLQSALADSVFGGASLTDVGKAGLQTLSKKQFFAGRKKLWMLKDLGGFSIKKAHLSVSLFRVL